MTFATLKLRREDAVLVVAIDRPDALNALNATVWDELDAVLEESAADASVNVLVLTGGGDKAFVAGSDVKEMAGMGREEAMARSWRGMRLYDRMRNHPQPIVAAINGYALGGGMLLALACDVRIAADSATLGYPEIRLALLPGTGGTVLLDRMVGPALARAICLTGEHFSAERAREMGLVWRVVPKAELMAEAMAVARRMAGYSPLALRELKGALNASQERDWTTARAAEVARYGACFASFDKEEGVRAFVEKRPPRFEGR